MSRQWILHVLVSLFCIAGHLSRWRGKANFRVLQKTDCIPFNSYKIQVVELSDHAGYSPELMAKQATDQTQWICTSCFYLLHWNALNGCVLGDLQSTVGLVVGCLNCRCDPQHFHHLTFLPRKVSPKPSRLRSFRETSPLCKSVGNRRNWWHHGCQSWTLWFVSRKAICCYSCWLVHLC